MPENVKLVDENGNLLKTLTGNIDDSKMLQVFNGNANFDWYGRHMSFHTGSMTTLSQAISIGAIQLPIAVTASVYLGGDPTGASLTIREGSVEETNIFRVTDITETTIIIDRPIANNYSSGVSIEIVNENMVTLTGTLTNPISYTVQPPTGVVLDVNRIILEIRHDSAGDNSKFGDIDDGLSNGVVLRVNKTNNKKVLGVWANNGEIAQDMYDLTYNDKAGAGLFGTDGRWTFNGVEKDNFIVRLIGDNDDKLEVLIQDDLSDLSNFSIKVKGNLNPEGIVAP